MKEKKLYVFPFHSEIIWELEILDVERYKRYSSTKGVAIIAENTVNKGTASSSDVFIGKGRPFTQFFEPFQCVTYFQKGQHFTTIKC